MKGSHWFVIGMVLLLGVMFLVEYHLPKKFVWTPTFGHYDRQPFGCALFDEMVGNAWPGEYALTKETLYQLATEDSTKKRAILMVAENLMLTEADTDALLGMAARGSKIMLVSYTFGGELSDTLRFKSTWGDFSLSALKAYATNRLKRDSLQWVGDPDVYASRSFQCYPQLCGSYLIERDSSATVLVQRDDSLAIAVSYRVGEGEVILVTTPLLFTNYGVVDGDNAAYILRLLSRMQGLPLLRTEGYGVTAQGQQSPFRYFLSQPPLRWGLYLTMITLVLFMVFTARRRQRVIPVVRRPDNKAMEFTELIGTLYFEKKDHADLVRKKFTYFAEALRRNIQVNVEEDGDDVALCHKIARKTGMKEEDVTRLFRCLRPVIRGEAKLDEWQMREYIDQMNKLMNQL